MIPLGRHRSLAQDERSLAAALAVTLLIVVVVAVSAGAYMGFKRLAFNHEPTVAVSFGVEQVTDRVRVLAVTSDATWERLRLRLVSVAPDGAAVCVGDTADGTPDILHSEEAADACDAGSNRMALAAPELPMPMGAGPVRGGDFLQFCASSAVTDVELAIIDGATGAVIRAVLFETIAVCG